jgi:16S rRNA (guanine1516-N2)-methyltransferase
MRAVSEDELQLQRTDLFVTTALKVTPELVLRAETVAAELNAPVVARRVLGLPKLFAERPEARRAILVQTDRLLLVDREGHEFFYHPNMAFLRLGNLLRGGRDLLIEAAELKPGDSVLDCTLGYASEAILCAHIVGDTGEVHGIEAVPELGLVVREGLKTVTTDHKLLNDAMRRVKVVHLGHHLKYLRACPSHRYDVVCFDPFFEVELEGSAPFAPIRFFGDHGRLLPEALAEARRVARRAVLVKTERWSESLEALGITERAESRSGKVSYGIARPLPL